MYIEQCILGMAFKRRCTFYGEKCPSRAVYAFHIFMVRDEGNGCDGLMRVWGLFGRGGGCMKGLGEIDYSPMRGLRWFGIVGDSLLTLFSIAATKAMGLRGRAKWL